MRFILKKMIKEQLKKQRKERKLTQVELAKLLNVSTTTVANWEQGNNTPTINELQRIADVVGFEFKLIIKANG